MNPINCLIVDDEELARMVLENYINRLPYLKIVGQCSNPIEALAILQNTAVDLLFLDIQMPDMLGTEFLKTLSQKPMVIFTTAYSEYAIESYELAVVDYLLKPFGFERFLQGVNKASELLALKENKETQVIESKPSKSYELVKSEHKVHKVFHKDILYIQSMREYVAYHRAEGRILSLDSLKRLETVLPTHKFIRIHKSYIIAKEKVTALEGNRVQIGKEKIPIGASYRECVLKELF